jgi:hypothetical protein
LVAWRGPYETWPSLATGVAIEGELRNHERGPADVHERAVHFSSLVGKDAQGGSFFGQVSGRLRGVFLSHTKEHDQANTNLTGDTPVHRHASLANTLHDSSHRKNASVTAIAAFEQMLGGACSRGVNVLFPSSVGFNAVFILVLNIVT